MSIPFKNLYHGDSVDPYQVAPPEPSDLTVFEREVSLVHTPLPRFKASRQYRRYYLIRCMQDQGSDLERALMQTCEDHNYLFAIN